MLFWFNPISDNDMFLPGNSPNHSWEYEPGHTIYIQPNYGRGVKAAIHHDGLVVDPDTLDRNSVLVSEENKLISILLFLVPIGIGFEWSFFNLGNSFAAVGATEAGISSETVLVLLLMS